jgi:hypothetical protein
MKRTILICITLLFTFGCKYDPNISSKMLDKIKSYDKFYSINKEDMEIELNRLTKRQNIKEYTVRLDKLQTDSINPCAAFQTDPNIYLFKNFESDPIDSNFVLAFKEINCLVLRQKGKDVYIESKIKDSIYILFKGELIKRSQFVKTTMLHKLNKNWYYFSYYFNPELDRKINWQRHG